MDRVGPSTGTASRPRPIKSTTRRHLEAPMSRLLNLLRQLSVLTVLVLQKHSIPFVDMADVVVGSLEELLDLIRGGR